MWSIDEINQVNRGLAEGLGLEEDIRVEDLQETIDTTKNSHYQGLLGILYNKGKFNESLTYKGVTTFSFSQDDSRLTARR